VSAVLADRVTCEPMRPQDLELIASVEQDLYEFPWTLGNFSDSLTAGYGAWVFRYGPALLGYAVVMMVLDEAHLLNFAVHRDWQGRGHGRRLLAHLEALARRGGANAMFLEVRPSNLPAVTLYRATGYVQIGVRRHYYPAHRGREDALVLRKGL
jgi:ribosomal-protein-alanine N-acetyltransferase